MPKSLVAIRREFKKLNRQNPWLAAGYLAEKEVSWCETHFFDYDDVEEIWSKYMGDL